MNEYEQAWVDVEQLLDERAQIISGYLKISRDEAAYTLDFEVYWKLLTRLMHRSLRTRLALAWRIIRGQT